MGAPRISEAQWRHYDSLRAKGWSMTAACRETGISRTTAYHREKGDPNNGTKRREVAAFDRTVAPKAFDELSDVAKRAVEDFGFFSEYYLGREAVPWRTDAAARVLEMLAEPEKTFSVINVPPGAGKSTCFTHDIPAWLIVRDRAIRCLIGSRTTKQAALYVGRLKRTFERALPYEGAQGVLAVDFGRFKPENRDAWAADKFIVEQLDGSPVEEKEPTVMAAAQESGFLGGRYNFCIWDDLVDSKNANTPQSRQKLQEWWELEAETRLEPDGVLILQGQRIGPEDLYRFCLNMREPLPEEVAEEVETDEELEELRGAQPQLYRHVVYPAHDEERCVGKHTRSMPPWPESCLLDPKRLSWRDLSRARLKNPRRYETTYQQMDVDAEGQLIQDLWLTGGTGADGVFYPGCYDVTRQAPAIPEGLSGPMLSVITADPSPTKWWSVQWWLYDPRTEFRYLIDHRRSPMDAPDFLDQVRGRFVGLAHEWVVRARELGFPVQYLILERNAAQRFMLQYNFVQEWSAQQRVLLVPHDTHANKADPEYGVQMLATAYRLGLVRLPYGQPFGKKATMPLRDELTSWPQGATDDCVMANWFFEFNLPQLKFKFGQRPTRSLPSWLRRAG